MELRNSKGQQIIEYVLLVAVVVVILITFLRPNGFFHKAVNKTLDISFNEMSHEDAAP